MSTKQYSPKKALRIYGLLSLCFIAAISLAPSLVAQEASSSSDDLSSLFDENFSSNEASSSQGSDEPRPLRIYGDHSVLLKMPIIPDYINWQSYSRSPQLQNTLGVEYKTQDVLLRSDWLLGFSMHRAGELELPQLIDFQPGENFIAWTPDKFQLSFGLQKFSWGSANGFNPTDNINARDLRDSFDPSKKLPVLALSSEFYPNERWQIQALISFYRFRPLLSDSIEQQLSQGLSQQLGRSVTVSAENFKPDLSNVQLGLKVSTYQNALDLSLSYLFSPDPNYSVASMNLLSPNPTVMLAMRDHLHIFGFDMRSNIGPLGLWLETAYTLGPDLALDSKEKRNHNLKWTLGFDANNYGPKSIFNTQFQFLGTWVPGYDWSQAGLTSPNFSSDLERGLNYQLGQISSGLQLGFMLRWVMDLSAQHVKFQVDAVYMLPLLYDTDSTTRYGGILLKPSISFSPADALNLDFGLNFAYSWQETGGELGRDSRLPIGANWYDSHIFLNLSYSWSAKPRL